VVLNNLDTKNVDVVNATVNTNTLTCNFYGKSGHIESTCYKKNGFPNNKGGKRTCTHCGRVGDTVDVCYKKHGFPPGHRLFNAKTKSNDLKNDEEDQEVRLTQQQYQALMSLIKPGNEADVSQKTSHISNISSSIIDPGNTFPNRKFMHTNSWILDSGATDHVSVNLKHFDSYETSNNIKVNLPNGLCVVATHTGIVKLTSDITLHNVLFIPGFHYNLIYISKLTHDSQLHVIFTNFGCFIQDQMNNKIGSVKFHEGLYVLSNCKSCISYVTGDKDNNVWHKRLGHLSDRRLNILQSQYNYIDYRKEHCDVCHMSKQKKLPFSNSESCADKCFDIIHVDIWGPSPTPSLHGHHYFLTIIDDSSRFTLVYLMCNKSETRTHLINFVNYAENQFETKIKIIRNDNGHEFKMNDFFNSKGIVHQISCVETPEQNGITEKNTNIY